MQTLSKTLSPWRGARIWNTIASSDISMVPLPLRSNLLSKHPPGPMFEIRFQGLKTLNNRVLGPQDFMIDALACLGFVRFIGL